MTECNQKNVVHGWNCTGFDGSRQWKLIHDVPKSIDCEECAEHADFEFKGLHDHVNVGLGKQVFDSHVYNKWVHEVIETNRACKKEGRC